MRHLFSRPWRVVKFSTKTGFVLDSTLLSVMPASTAHECRATATEAADQELAQQSDSFWLRDRYFGALSFNLAAFALPALYSTPAKLWIAKLDPNMVVVTE